MSLIVETRARKSPSTWEVFERRYQPIENADGEVMRDWCDVPDGIGHSFVWTVVDCDGKLFIVPGYHRVNYIGRIVTAKGWCDTEESNPGYRY